MNYLLKGVGILAIPGYRKFILIPLLANLILFAVLTTLMVGYFSDTIAWALDALPTWLNFLSWIMWPIMVALFLLVYGLSFSFITNIFAAPFNGLLAEKIQQDQGMALPSDESLSKLIVRTLAREVKKLMYFIWYGVWVALGLFIISFIPLVNLLVPFLAFAWGAWCLSVQYLDYAADNNHQSFKAMRTGAKRSMFNTLTFGGCITFLMMVPVVNIFVMPVAVAGATYMWLDRVHGKGDTLKEVNQRPLN